MADLRIAFYVFWVDAIFISTSLIPTVMDADAAFAEIRKEIAEGRGSQVGPRLLEIAESDSDPMNRIKCLSLLKVIDVGGVSKEILRMLMVDLPEDRQTLVQIAGALRGLEYPSSALSILMEMEQDDSIIRMSALCMIDLDEYEDALAKTELIREVTLLIRYHSACTPRPSRSRQS